MTGKHHEQYGTGFRNLEQGPEQSSENDLDRMLDSALAKYAAVEPRMGLEERILANLRAEPGTDRMWWQWRLAIAVTAVVIVTVTVALRYKKLSQPLVKNPSSVTMPNPQGPETKTPETQMANLSGNTAPSRRKPVRHAGTHSTQPAAAVYPKLDQFPSPRPLSEQEKILALYIDQNPQRAALVAEARMDALRHDDEEYRRLATEDSQQ